MLIRPLISQTWTIDKRLTCNNVDSVFPAIAEDPSDQIHLVWADEWPGNLEIYYKKYLAVGNRWVTKRLTYKPEVSLSPAIAIDTLNRIYVVWEDNYPGNWEI